MAFRDEDITEGSGCNFARKSIGIIAGAFILIFILNFPLYAQNPEQQGDWKWPVNPENIQVLSEVLNRTNLRFY